MGFKYDHPCAFPRCCAIACSRTSLSGSLRWNPLRAAAAPPPPPPLATLHRRVLTLVMLQADQVVEKNKNWFGGGNAAVRMIQCFVRGNKERQVTCPSASLSQSVFLNRER